MSSTGKQYYYPQVVKYLNCQLCLHNHLIIDQG